MVDAQYCLSTYKEPLGVFGGDGVVVGGGGGVIAGHLKLVE